MNFDDFLNLFNNTSVDFDNYYGDQCVDLVQFWSRNLGGPRFTGDAHDIIDQAGSFYTRIDNTPDGVPQKGDIIVWGSNFNGGPGHVGISTGKGDVNNFDCFEQNDPTGSICHIKNYTSYFGVVGWLRPKQLPTDNQAVLDELRSERDNNWNLYQSEIQKNTDLQVEFDKYKASHPITTVVTGNPVVTTTITNPPKDYTISDLIQMLINKLLGR